jgi:glycosyltransferase involved in cell wall biosynthesis
MVLLVLFQHFTLLLLFLKPIPCYGKNSTKFKEKIWNKYLPIIGSKMNPLISIVIPTYNRAHLILEALETCVLQTYRPIEIVVVDDGSTDRTIASVQDLNKGSSHQDVTLKIVKQENKGGNVARNNGIKNSSGEFIAFLDSDDLWNKTKLK